MISQIKAILELQRAWLDTVPDDISFDAVARNLSSLIRSLAKEPETDWTLSGRVLVVRAMDADEDGEFIVAVQVGSL